MATPVQRLGILISGAGRTLFNLLDCIEEGLLSISIDGVISSRLESERNCAVFERCRKEGIPITIIRPKDFSDEYEFSVAQAGWLDEHKVDLVCMAGYLVFWSIPEHYKGRVLNIHPSLLPKFGGRGFFGCRVHEAVLAAGETESGCTVHYADNVFDHGPIILQRRVPVLVNDTPETLGQRVFEEECKAYPEAIQLVIEK